MNISTTTEEEDIYIFFWCSRIFPKTSLIHLFYFAENFFSKKNTSAKVCNPIRIQYMYSTNCKDFFSLDCFDHAILWEDEELVWTALFRLEAYFQNWSNFKKKINIPSNIYIEHPEKIALGEDTVLEPGAYIQGPCILGNRCVVRHGAYLRAGVICGDGCVIGHGSEVKRSILFDGVQIAHHGYVGDAIIGNRVRLGAGVKCANSRFDRRKIAVNKISTDLKKFSCVIGDDTQIGCNAVVNPGTLIGRNCIAHPLVSLRGLIPSHTQIRGASDSSLDFSPVGTAILDWLRR